MVFTKEDGILIKVLRQSKSNSARKLLEEFPDSLPDNDWSCSAMDRLLRQIDSTGSADRKSGNSRERTVCTRDVQMSVQMATTLSTNCNWWYCVRTAKATFPYWKLLFLSSIFKQLLLKNCAMDFVEICNFCIRKAISEAAKRIFNSDRICRSYCDFYFGVTFLEHTVVSSLCNFSYSLPWTLCTALQRCSGKLDRIVSEIVACDSSPMDRKKVNTLAMYTYICD